MDSAPSDQLNCNIHPFFCELPPLPMDLKLFYNKVLAFEGNIFEVCSISWIQSKKLLVEELYVAALSSKDMPS